MDKYVCIRLVRMWGVDLTLFRFDGNLTWAVFFMNADQAIYGRYGTRSAQDAMKDNSLKGFKNAARAALRLHRDYPMNAKDLSGKTAQQTRWRTPESFPAFKGMYRKEDISVGGCIHCHFVPEGRLKSFWSKGKPIPDRFLWTYPMPNLLGIFMDPNECATVKAVERGSVAEKAGIHVGDKIARMAGQPIISTADIQWVLHNTKEPSQLSVEIDRQGMTVQVTIPIVKAWRRKASFTYSWEPTFPIAPRFRSKEIDQDRRKALGLAKNVLALEVKLVSARGRGWGAVAESGFQFVGDRLRRGDVIIEVDGLKQRMRESDLMAYVWQKKKPAEALEFVVLRQGQKHPITLRLPMP